LTPYWICHFGLWEGVLRLPPLVGTVAAWTRLRTRLQSRHGVAAAPPWSDLPSSKTTRSEKGPGPRVRRRLSGRRRVGSGRHLRALPRAGSTAVRSPSGERRTPASGWCRLSGWLAAGRQLSLIWLRWRQRRRGRNENDPRVSGSSGARGFV
jgi:hypothetical protein